MYQSEILHELIVHLAMKSELFCTFGKLKSCVKSICSNKDRDSKGIL